MIKNIPEPKISRDFTIDDIHKIREWNYERMKDATPQERKQDTEDTLRWFREKMQSVRNKSR